MIICVCKAVNDRAIRRAIDAGHDTFDALQFELGIGTCCGKCVASACELLCESQNGAHVARPGTQSTPAPQRIHVHPRPQPAYAAA